MQVHVFSPNGSEVKRMLLFRDRLRTDAGDRNLYLGTKRALAARRWIYVQEYADATSCTVRMQSARGRRTAGHTFLGRLTRVVDERCARSG